jgi:hypothetical protein
MAALQFWIRGDLVAEQRRRLEQLGVAAVPMGAGARRPDGTLVSAAWTRIEAGPGDPETERARIANAIGTEPDEVTGPYAVH